MLRTFLIFFIFVVINFVSFAQQDLFNKINRMKDSVSIENLSNHIKSLQYASGHYSRVNLTPGFDSAVVYVKNQFDSIYNLTSVELDTFYIPDAVTPYNKKPIFNIVATLQGNLDGTFIVGAHLDCSASRMGATMWNQQWKTIKAPGADDNATGVAGLIELARILSDTSFQYTNRYTIKFVAFGAEESGPAYLGHHYGSEHFADELRKKNENIIGAIIMDMVGYNDNFDYTAIVSNNNSKWLGDKIIEANNLYAVGLTINNPPFPADTYSDHASFWDKGYRSVLLIENAPPWNNSTFYSANPYYHTSSDTLGTLNMELVKKVTQLDLVAAASFASKLAVNVNEPTNLVEAFRLYQNYPNPFNPTTKIKYKIPSNKNPFLGGARRGLVTLKIYDILGNEIATLVNKEQTPGKYEVEFDAGKYNLSSGIYFYQLKIGSFIQTNKMVVLK